MGCGGLGFGVLEIFFCVYAISGAAVRFRMKRYFFMEQHKNQFYLLWKSVGRVPADDFDVSTMDSEDLVLAENMVGEGLTRLMELKTRIANAKHKLQTSNLQRGVLPQTEERKESVRPETYAAKKETIQDKFGFAKTQGVNFYVQGNPDNVLEEQLRLQSQYHWLVPKEGNGNTPHGG